MTDHIILNYALQRMRELGFRRFHWRPEIFPMPAGDTRSFQADNEYWYPYLFGFNEAFNLEGLLNVQAAVNNLQNVLNVQQSWFDVNGSFTGNMTDLAMTPDGINAGYTCVFELQDSGDTFVVYCTPNQPWLFPLTAVLYKTGPIVEGMVVGVANRSGYARLEFLRSGSVITFINGYVWGDPAHAFLPGVQIRLECESTQVSFSATNPVLGSPEFTGLITVRSLCAFPVVLHFLRFIPHNLKRPR